MKDDFLMLCRMCRAALILEILVVAVFDVLGMILSRQDLLLAGQASSLLLFISWMLYQHADFYEREMKDEDLH